MGRWTQPVCEDRFQQMYPGREPYRLKVEPDEALDLCCYCQRPTVIYVRLDPSTVPFPREPDDAV